MGKVIDITTRLKTVNTNPGPMPSQLGGHDVIDMTTAIEQKRNKDRRQVERIILNGLFGAKAVIPNRGLVKIFINDISTRDLGFEIDPQEGEFKIGEEVAMRIYFNQETYFPFSVKIHRYDEITMEDGRVILQHGARFSSENKEAIDHFVQFLDLVTVGMKTDKGDVLIPGFGG